MERGDYGAVYGTAEESIRRFPTQHQFATLIHAAGFRCVSYENFTGGIVAGHSGFKPLRAD